jgi:hypothetical protein
MCTLTARSPVSSASKTSPKTGDTGNTGNTGGVTRTSDSSKICTGSTAASSQAKCTATAGSTAVVNLVPHFTTVTAGSSHSSKFGTTGATPIKTPPSERPPPEKAEGWGGEEGGVAQEERESPAVVARVVGWGVGGGGGRGGEDPRWKFAESGERDFVEANGGGVGGEGAGGGEGGGGEVLPRLYVEGEARAQVFSLLCHSKFYFRFVVLIFLL